MQTPSANEVISAKIREEKLRKAKEILSQVIHELADDMQLNDYKLDKKIEHEKSTNIN